MDQGIIQAVKKINHYKLLSSILENAENREQFCQAPQKMLAGTAGLNEGREAHLLDAMKILHHVWNDMEVSTIARCWAKSAILAPTMNADILAEHAIRTKCAISQETKDLIDNIVEAFSKLSLPTNSPSSDNLTENIRGFVDLQQQCSLDELAVELEKWTEIEESSDFAELLSKDAQAKKYS